MEVKDDDKNQPSRSTATQAARETDDDPGTSPSEDPTNEPEVEESINMEVKDDDKNQPSTSTATQAARETDDDPATSPSEDPTNEHFDPLKALYNTDLKASSKHFLKYDNLAMFESALKKRGISLVGSKPKAAEIAATAKAKETKKTERPLTGRISNKPSREEIAQRRFLPHQMPVKGTGGVKLRHSRNVLKQMEDCLGPLAALYKMMQEKSKVKIYTRKEKGVRGYITGYVIAFDKHWNVLLRNAYEVWQRRKFNFSSTAANLGKAMDCSTRLTRLGIKLPEMEVKSLNRKYVEIKRKLNQMMIRGEQIVLITGM